MNVRPIVLIAVAALLPLLAPTLVAADGLTMAVQEYLSALGYDAGPAEGKETLDTTIAISKFQAENEMEVTGAVSRELAIALSDRAPDVLLTPTASVAFARAAAAPETSPEQACLESKAETLQESLLNQVRDEAINAAVRTVLPMGGADITRLVNALMSAEQTKDDVGAIAAKLGLTEEDVAECQNL